MYLVTCSGNQFLFQGDRTILRQDIEVSVNSYTTKIYCVPMTQRWPLSLNQVKYIFKKPIHKKLGKFKTVEQPALFHVR